MDKVIEKMLENMSEEARKKFSASGDYLNAADGLIYCGKCHTTKQVRVSFRGETKRMWCMCHCQAEAAERERVERKAWEFQAEIARLRSASMMSDDMQRCRFENWSRIPGNEGALAKCKKYAGNFDLMSGKNQGLLFWGGTGTGKTFAAACIANELLDKGVPVIMTSLAELLGSNNGFGINEEFLYKLNSAKLLIIDDFGAERSTDFAMEKIFGVIDSRYKTGLPMIITTNLDFAEMKNPREIKFARIYDRILERCYPIKFAGNSFRKNNAKNRFAEMKDFFDGGEKK